MLRDIIAVRPLTNWELEIEFEDGVVGIVDVAELVRFEGVFSALRDPNEFQTARVDSELGTVVWPCGADLDPDVLYALVSGQSLPQGMRPRIPN